MTYANDAEMAAAITDLERRMLLHLNFSLTNRKDQQNRHPPPELEIHSKPQPDHRTRRQFMQLWKWYERPFDAEVRMRHHRPSSLPEAMA